MWNKASYIGKKIKQKANKAFQKICFIYFFLQNLLYKIGEPIFLT